MPWPEKSTMSLRHEFVLLAQQEGANISELCRRTGVSRKTAYKWLDRFDPDDPRTLLDRSRRPVCSPKRTVPGVEKQLLMLRDRHPAWGARKLKRRLQDLGVGGLPSVSTITAILHRHGRIDPKASEDCAHWQRFERAAPNQLWQMDFKGHFEMANGQRCQPLTVLDDHSRFNLVLQACADQRGQTVQARLTQAFRQYGLPECITMDNGAPWGTDSPCGLTQFTAWLVRLGIGISHSRPYHPQTQGKDERFHRTLNVELLKHNSFRDLDNTQIRFDHYRQIYNLERPHESLDLAVPATRYRISHRPFPEVLPPIEYASGDQVKRVRQGGHILIQGRYIRISNALIGQPVALRPTAQDGVFNVYYCRYAIATIDLNQT